MRFSISSSSNSLEVRALPQPNSLFSLSASTTVTMLSSRARPSLANCGTRRGMLQMVEAIGAGSQIPLASITM